jgi:predicted amidohydrolase/GNAT superfamily N-acetyltransferase
MVDDCEHDAVYHAVLEFGQTAPATYIPIIQQGEWILPADTGISAIASTPTLVVRTAKLSDVPGIVKLSQRAFGEGHGSSAGQVQGQITVYPEGQFVVDMGGVIVGYAASFRIDEASALKPHTWAAITGGGYASRHDPGGDWLYGMEVAVDPDQRRLRIGQRLYDTRIRLCENEGLKGIVFGGRMPGWARRKKTYPTAESYIDAVIQRKVSDPVIGFQIRHGFRPIGVMKGYSPYDEASGGYATHMVWRNPYADKALTVKSIPHGLKTSVRVASVQYQQRLVGSFEEFMKNVEYFVDVTSDYRSDFVVFPELFTLQLLVLEKKKMTPAESLLALTAYTDRFVEAMKALAVSYNINIIGGSHPTLYENGDVKNVAYVFLRDGQVHTQEKLHPTPSEKHWWNVKGGDSISSIMTDCGPIGVMVCYDSEFPEVARRLADEGCRLLFVPFCTDNRQGYLRVRYCSQARAIENQCYVVMSGNVGNLPNVENMDINYAQSCILTPCDFPFARDGVAAETTENVETVAVADLDLGALSWARAEGSVRNLRDRRFDLYKLNWTDGG